MRLLISLTKCISTPHFCTLQLPILNGKRATLTKSTEKVIPELRNYSTYNIQLQQSLFWNKNDNNKKNAEQSKLGSYVLLSLFRRT